MSAFRAILIALSFGSMSLPAMAQVYYWDSNGNSLWSNTNNWDPAGLPGPLSIVELSRDISTTQILLNGDRTIGSLSFGGDQGYILFDDTLTVMTGFISVASPSSGAVEHIIASNLSAPANLSINISSNATLRLAGAVTGPGLVKSGSGTMVLTGSALFTAGATVSGGTLQIGNGGTTGSITGNIANNATLIFNRSDNISYSGVVSGSGGLTKSGNGTLTLTGSNTYAGATAISTGTLAAGANNTLSNSSAVTISSGAALNVGSTAQSIGSLAGGGSVTLASGGVLAAGSDNSSTTFSGVLSGSGAFTKTGAGTLILAGNNTYTGPTTVSAGTLQLGNGGTSGWITGNIVNNSALAFNRSDNVTYSGVVSGSGGLTKSGNGTLTLTGNNTYGGATTISSGTLAAGANNTLSSSSAVTISSTAALSIGSTAQSIGSLAGGGSVATLSGGSLTAGGNDASTIYSGTISGAGALIKTGSGTLTLSKVNSYTGGTTIAEGTLLLANGANMTGNILNQATFAIDRTDSLTYSGIISGTGGLTKAGAGVFTLTGANTYSGATTISSGTFLAGANNTLSSASAFAVSSGATLGLGSTSQTIRSLTGNGSVTSAAGGSLTVGGDNTSTTFSGVLSGSGALIKTGTGILTLTGDNTSTGTTTISAGALQLGNGGAAGSFAGNIVNNSALIFNRSAPTYDYNGVIIGTGSLTKLGDGTVRLGGASTFTGGITISGGVLTVGTGGTTGSITSNVINNSILIFNRTSDYAYSGTISGSGSLYKVNSNILTLSGSNSYSGVTHVEGGILKLSTNAAVSGDISNAANVTFDALDGGTYAGVISGTGSVTVNRSVVLTGSNTYTGGTTLNNNSFLQVGNGGVTGMIQGNIHSEGGDISFKRSDDVTFGGSISGNGRLLQSGPGTLTLTNSFSNDQSVYVGGGSLRVAGGAEIQVRKAEIGTLYYASGHGTFAVDGAGTSFTANDFVVGNGAAGTPRTGTLNVVNGGALISTGTITLGVGSGGNGILNVSGAGSTATTVDVNIGGTGSSALDINNGGKVTTATVSGEGAITLHNGTLALIGDDSLNNPFTFNSGGGTLDVAGSKTVSVLSAISGSGSLIKTGSGTLALSGTNTYSGNTTIDAGTLHLEEGATLAGEIILAGGAFSRDLAAGASLAGTVDSTSDLGGRDTTASILAGTTSTGTLLLTSFSSTSSATNDSFRQSDVYVFAGTGTDLFVLQLETTSVDADSILGWLATGDTWTNAVAGNTGNNATAAMQGFEGSFASFETIYGNDLSSYVGAYGVDTASQTVWAVLNHNSEFAVVPEPSAGVLLVLGALIFFPRRARSTRRK